jgi:hypothetical protein
LFQLLIDHSDYNTLTALYISIYFGMILKFVWAYRVEYSFSETISNSADTKFIHPLIFYKRNSFHNINIILSRIIKHIRRKEYSKEDDEEPISFLYTQLS